MMYNVASLFAGVGGICLGFRRASKNFNLVVANEMDKDACITYRENFGHNLIEGDIEKILNPQIPIQEYEFLKKRKIFLEDNKINQNFDKILKKDAVKKLKDSYLSKAMKNDFSLTPSLRKKIINANIKLEDFLISIEYDIVQSLLKESNEDIVKNRKNYYEKDKEKLLEKKIDILTAGFPCQAFSIAGERKGFSDHRGELFYRVIDLIKELESKNHGKPRVLLLENVKNLVTHDKGNTFKIIKNELENLNYKVVPKVLNTYKYSTLPQNRERIFIVCFLNEEDAANFNNFNDLNILNRTKEDLQDAIKNTIDYTIDKSTNPELYYTKDKYPNYFMSEKEFEVSDRKVRINLKEEINTFYEIYQIRRGMYVRKNQSNVCPTLTANMGTGGHNVPLIKVKDGIRKLSPKDCFNLQGFKVERDYKLPLKAKKASLYKQSGNAVSVDIIELIAKKIEKALLKTDKK